MPDEIPTPAAAAAPSAPAQPAPSQIRAAAASAAGSQISNLRSQIDALDAQLVAAAVQSIFPQLYKPGVRTTEFWLVAGALASLLGLAAAKVADPTVSSVLSVLCALLYALIRTNHRSALIDKTIASVNPAVNPAGNSAQD